MRIKATVKLELMEYNYCPSEYLRVNVSFKEDRKLITTKISRCLIDSDDYDSIDLFFDDIRKTLKDRKWIEGVVVDMVENHFNNKRKSDNELNARKDILGEINSFNMEVEVEIKQ